MEKAYSIKAFEEIIAKLRSENGCPWDKEQTHESLRPCMTEEAAELLAAIRIYGQTGNAENLQEELGDILLQVMMHSQIAKEEGLFSFQDVVQVISEKMIRRHPHVFGEVVADTSREVLANWEEIKKEEKEGKEWIASPLREIPKELPALVRSVKILKKVDKLYEERKTYDESIDAIIAKMEQLREKSTRKIEEKEPLIAEVLLEISNISRIEGLHQEQLLQDKIEEMIEKYEKS